jgi:acyl-CoA thioesterase FadM
MAEAEPSEGRYLEINRSLPIRTSDIDGTGRVGHLTCHRWFEQLRYAVFAKHYSIIRAAKEGLTPIVLKCGAEFHRPFRLGKDVLGKAWVARVSKHKWKINFELWRGNDKLAEGVQTGAYLRLKDGQIVPLPARLIKAVQRDMKAQEEGGSAQSASDRRASKRGKAAAGVAEADESEEEGFGGSGGFTDDIFGNMTSEDRPDLADVEEVEAIPVEDEEPEIDRSEEIEHTAVAMVDEDSSESEIALPETDDAGVEEIQDDEEAPRLIEDDDDEYK